MAVGPYQDSNQKVVAVQGVGQHHIAWAEACKQTAHQAKFSTAFALQGAGVDVLFEQNGVRRTDFRRGKSLGTRDHLVHWPKPAARPEWMTPEQYQAFPDALTVRRGQGQPSGVGHHAARSRPS